MRPCVEGMRVAARVAAVVRAVVDGDSMVGVRVVIHGRAAREAFARA